MTTNEINEIKANLSQFTGSEHYYKILGGIMYTDSLKYLAETCQCYWFLDVICSHALSNPKVNKEPFQVYKLTVNANHSAIVEISDGNDNILDKQRIEFTDFPLDSITVWCIDGIILSPSEY